MGYGMIRASQAAARSRWDGKLSPEMRDFLGTLNATGEPMTRGQTGPVETLERMKARRTCSRLGLAEEARRKLDDKVGWQITDAGRAALRGEWETK